MTLTLELPPAMERGLEHAAQRHGMAVEKYAFDVLAREAGTGEKRVAEIKVRNAAFLRLLEETAPAIQAATRHITSDDVMRAIHETREERTVELLAVNGIIVEPEPYETGGSHEPR